MFTRRAMAALAAAALTGVWGTARALAVAPFVPGSGLVEICHVPPGNPQNRKTIRVPLNAVGPHLAHGDRFGPCEAPLCSRFDTDFDGVNNCDDHCKQTPPGDIVDARGCSLVVLRVSAGPDVTAMEGDWVLQQGTVEVVQGGVAPENLVWQWHQIAGEPAPFSAIGPEFSWDTVDTAGSFTFRVTVSTDDGSVSVSDEFGVEVLSAGIVHVAAGKWHNVALFGDSRTVAWGWNRYGQLGDGSMDEDLADADAAARHTVVATMDGTVFAFGDDAISDFALPVQVGGMTDVVQVAATTEGAAMLRNDGVLMGFTAPNGGCVLGGVSPVNASGEIVAVQVAGATTNLVQVAAGASHLVALDADGVAWVWGSRFGCMPRPVLTDVVPVTAGDTDFCLFIRGDGTAWGLGYNFHGQLGNGTTVTNYSVATQVLGLSDVVAIAAGDRHSLFVQGDGSLWTAGWNRYCQLGLEEEVNPTQPLFGTNILSPAQVDLADVVLVAGGENHSLAVTADGKVWAWGLNNVGQLHLNTFTVLPGQVCMPMEVEIE